MDIQKKSLIIFLVTLIAVLIIISTVVSAIFLASYTSLEQQYVSNDVRQAVSRISNEESSLSAVVSDWGPWDDTYDFVNGNKPEYVQANLLPVTYSNLMISMIVITDRNGKVVYSGAYDAGNDTLGQVPDAVISQLTPGNPLMNMSDPRGAATGILMLPDSPMIVASRPIVHSDFSGEPQGVVIMGRSIDNVEVARLARLTQPTLAIQRLSYPGTDPSVLEAFLRSNETVPVTTQVLDRNTIAGYALIRDITGNDAIVLSFTRPRDIYQQGVTTTVKFIWIILASGLILGIVSMVLLDRFVLSRIKSLHAQVNRIGSGGLSDRVTLAGNDEISGLADGINRMLADAESAHAGIARSESRFHDLSDLLPQTIFEMDTGCRLLYVNKTGGEQFGLTAEKIAEGVTIREFVLPGQYAQMERGLAGVMAGGRSSGEVYNLKRPDGTLIQAIVTTSPIRRDDRIIGFRGVVVDVSERIRLETALEENREYLQTLIASVQVGILVIDSETHRIIDANPAALGLLCRTREEVIGKVCHRFVCPTEEGACPVTDLGRSVDNTERILINARGERVPIIKHVIPITLHGRPCLLETFIDNTARQKMAAALRESEATLSGILRASPVGFFRTDVEGRLIFVNDTFVQITGYPADKILNRGWHEIVMPDKRERVREEIAAQTRTGDVVKNEAQIIRPDGRTLWISGQAAPLKAADGSLRGWVGTITDITDRKTMEETLAKSEENYRALAENTADILFSMDQDGIFTYVSPQINRYGFLKEEILASPILTFLYPDDRKATLANLNRLYDGKGDALGTMIFRLVDKWGYFHWIEAKISVRPDAFGRPIGTYGILRDITERRKAEDAMQLANKKLNLLNNITRHDILNTITGLLGCVDMAMAATDPPGREDLLRQIRELTRQIQRQITFTREYQDVGINAPVWQNLHDLIGRASSSFPSSGITFVAEIENTEVFADPLLEKVFYNLIDNAIRYGEGVRTIRFYYLISDRGLDLICEDDGAGIPQDQKERVFERGVGKNTGMGLFLSREILMITGITIRENGIPGRGARFEIHIPNGAYRFLRR